jgi:hypothetical protein
MEQREANWNLSDAASLLETVGSKHSNLRLEWN